MKQPMMEDLAAGIRTLVIMAAVAMLLYLGLVMLRRAEARLDQYQRMVTTTLGE